MSGGVGGWRGAIPVTRPDRGRPPHIAPQNAGYLSQADTPLAVNVASNQFHEVSQCTQEGERPFGVAAAFVNQSGQMFFGFSVCSFRNEKRYRVAIGLDHRAYALPQDGPNQNIGVTTRALPVIAFLLACGLADPLILLHQLVFASAPG